MSVACPPTETCSENLSELEGDATTPVATLPGRTVAMVERDAVDCGVSSDWFERLLPHAAPILTLAVLVLGLYWPVTGYDFVNWDDPWYVVENPRITSWQLSNLWAIATEVAIKNYAPLTIFSYLVDHSLWGTWPGGYHLTNWLLHLANVLLVYTLIARLTGSRFAGWLTAALFAVHPVHIETVAWIASRKGLLSATFLLLSMIFWLRPNRSSRHEGYGLLFFAMALLSKAIAVVAPAVVLLYDVLVARMPLSKALPRQIIPGFLSVWLLLATMTAQSVEMGGVRDHLQLSKGRILAVNAVIVWRYVGLLASPRNLCVLYDPPTSGVAGKAALAALGWLAVFAFAIVIRKKWPLATLAVTAFVLFLLPVLNLFPITTLMNDRYLYLPSIPVFALGAVLVARLAGGIGTGASANKAWQTILPTRRFACGVLVAAMLAGYAGATWQYLPVWKNGMSLWRYAIGHVPQLPVARIQLANALHDSGRNREAVSILAATLESPRLDHFDRERIHEKLAAWK